MKIRYKTDHSIIREGVEQAILNQDAGWIRKNLGITVFYPPTHWEPVEEWVDIQVRKGQWEQTEKHVNMMEVRLHSDEYAKRGTLSWRYPQ